MNKVFDEVDIDKSGTIDYNEFLACTMNVQRLSSQTTLRKAFNLFDKDGDNFITSKEIKDVLQNNAETLDS